ncbi:Dispatched-like protein [Sarcoptes scabiei]|uniref:Dispatched-like protein n=1 Tax=Sarcoptes scabiei TaxID=52283 RepID=A0A132AFI0_SARSC|nr:Dispatched-like protein [Sarcoptes scabiei]
MVENFSVRFRTSITTIPSFTTFAKIVPKSFRFFQKDFLQNFFDKIILKLIFNHHFKLLSTLSLISMISFYLVLINPRLKVPNTEEFQIFESNHLFERYDLEYRNRFWFSRFDSRPSLNPIVASNSSINNLRNSYVLPIRIVFGIVPQDNGNHLDPYDRGSLNFDSKFDLSSQRSQVWLLEFCRDIRLQSFQKPTHGPLSTNCFIETLKSWMDSRKCVEIIGDAVIDHFPCCEMTRFPYEPRIFDQCLQELVDRIHRTPSFIFSSTQAGPRFNRTDSKAKVLVIEFDSIYDGAITSYDNIHSIWITLNRWVEEQLKTAPEELRSGWFITNNLEFYSLQHSLASGIGKLILLSVSIALITLIITTRHLKYSLISFVSIVCIIVCSLAIMILLDWHLNIIECIVISLTIGLSIDATLHYTIAFKNFANLYENRLLGIQMTIAQIGGPVAMSSLTTFIAGSIMLFSTVLAYIQIGTFLMVISVSSFIFSTLFHLSLFNVLGNDFEWNHFEKLRRLINFWKKFKIQTDHNHNRIDLNENKSAQAFDQRIEQNDGIHSKQEKSIKKQRCLHVTSI